MLFDDFPTIDVLADSWEVSSANDPFDFVEAYSVSLVDVPKFWEKKNLSDNLSYSFIDRIFFNGLYNNILIYGGNLNLQKLI